MFYLQKKICIHVFHIVQFRSFVNICYVHATTPCLQVQLVLEIFNLKVQKSLNQMTGLSYILLLALVLPYSHHQPDQHGKLSSQQLIKLMITYWNNLYNATTYYIQPTLRKML